MARHGKREKRREKQLVKVTLESTTKIVDIQTVDGSVKARVWQGQTDSGVPVQAFIPLISPEVRRSDPHHDELTAEFDRDLKRHAEPRPTVELIPLRFII